MTEPYIIFLSSSAPDKDNPKWGDYRFVRDLKTALEARGQSVEIIGNDPQEIAGAKPMDVLFRIVGSHLPDPHLGCINFVWQISHPDNANAAITKYYDRYFVASKTLMEDLSDGDDAHLRYLPQATAWIEDAADLPGKSDRIPKALFIGNAKKKFGRRIIDLAVAADIPFAVIGNRWADFVAPEHILDDFVDAGQLQDLYRQYLVALNDHRPQMRRANMVNNRVYDTLACGAYVICDDIALPNSSFNSVVDVVKTPEELRTAFDRALKLEDAAFRDRQKAALDLLDPEFTFAAAADKILDEVTAQHQTQKQTKKAPLARLKTVLSNYFGGGKTSETVVLLDPHIRGADEIEEDAAILLARRVLAASDTILKNPKAQLVRDTTTDRPKERALEINEWSALYADFCDYIVDTTNWRGGGQLKPAAQAILKKSALRASMYLERRAHCPEEIDESDGEPLDKNWASRHLNQMHTTVGMHFDTLNRDYQKTFVRLPPMQNSYDRNLRYACKIHAYYLEILPELLRPLQGIEAFKLYLSTDTEAKAAEIETTLKAHGFEDYDIRVFPNIGRDVYPKLFGFSDILDQHDVFLHLHTKKSDHIDENKWLMKILADIAPGKAGIDRIFSIFEECPQVGLLYPRPQTHFEALRWAANYEIARDIGRKLGIEKLPESGHFRFPAGSMYWARSDVLKKVAALELTPSDFPTESGQLDGTPAHALERLMGLIPELLDQKAVCYSGTKDAQYSRFRNNFDDVSEFQAWLNGPDSVF
ncbi:MAG: rhamnan synthesis F family protein [Pseudomonadota bacterium]